MFRLIALLLLTANLVFGQDQVSKILKPSRISPSFDNQNVGFFQHDGDTYMVEDYENMNLYKLVNDSFKHVHNFCTNFSFPITSGRYYTYSDDVGYMIIVDTIYYRFRYNQIEVIDLINNKTLYYRDLADDGLRFANNMQVLNDSTIFFDFRYDEYVLDIKNDILKQAPSLGDIRWPHFMQDLFIKFEGGRIDGHYAFSGVEKSAEISNSNLIASCIAQYDDLFFALDSNSVLHRVDYNFDHTSYPIDLDSLELVRDIIVNGTKLIVSKINANRFGVEVFDWRRNIRLQDFVLTDLRYGEDTPSITLNRDRDSTFNILGYWKDYSSGDDPRLGSFCLIDHLDNSFIPLTEYMSYAARYTAKRLQNDIYFHAVVEGGWSPQQSSIMHYDYSQKIISKHYVNGSTAYDMVLGPQIEGKILLAAESWDLAAGLYFFKPENGFEMINSGHINYKTGLTNLVDVATLDDELFFSTDEGFYRCNNSTQSLFEIPYFKPAYDDRGRRPILNLEDQLVVGFTDESSVTFNHFDKNTGQLSSQQFMHEMLFNYNFFRIGSRLFTGPHSSIYKCYDPISKTLTDLEGPKNYGIKEIFEGQTFNLIIDHGQNFKTLHNHELHVNNIDLAQVKSTTATTGPEDIFYLGVNDSVGNYHVHSLNTDLEIENLATGNGTILAMQTQNEGSPISVALISDNDFSKIIYLNNQSLEEETLPVNVDVINDVSNGAVALSSDDAYLVLIEGEAPAVHPKPMNTELIKSVILDSTVLFIAAASENIHISKFGLRSKEWQNISIPTCKEFGYKEIEVIHEDFILLSAQCGLGYEPYIINLDKMEFSLVKDIYPEGNHSRPMHFTTTKNHVYFTAELPNKSRQWFKMDISNPSKIVQVEHNNAINVYPNPSADHIRLDEDIKDLYINNINGYKVLHIKAYSAGQRIDTDSLVPGTYIITGQLSNLSSVQIKFVKS